VAVQHDGRDPDRGRTERLDVVQFLLDTLEIAAVNRTAVGRVVIALGTVVGNVPVEKAVGHDLINTLRLPEFVRRILGVRTSRNEAERDCQARRSAKMP